MDRNKILYYGSTGLLTLIMGGSALMYFFNHEEVIGVFTSLGFPTYLIYPLAIAKILGLIAVWTRKSRLLMEWAYAGFFFDTLIAGSAHMVAGDDSQYPALVALLLVFISHRSGKALFDS